MADRKIYDDEGIEHARDPDESPIADWKLFTQPYDLVIDSLLGQIDDETVHLRQLSSRPDYQRMYVWSDRLASLLIESMLLNVPIPPCYLAQNRDFKLDVIDGQQRIYSVYRFAKNQFRLTGLKVMPGINGKYFYELSPALRRKLETYTLRCVIVTNDSDPEIKFEVFERLNTNTMPLNAQELRNSICRGSLIDLLGDLATHRPWLRILGRRTPDKRMRDEELILRFFGFYILGVEKYRTPQKNWLDSVANLGRDYSDDRIEHLSSAWKSAIEKSLIVFEPRECFRKPSMIGRRVVNRALMDLTMASLNHIDDGVIRREANAFRELYTELLLDEEFDDLITSSIDHKSRTLRRFDLWTERITSEIFA